MKKLVSLLLISFIATISFAQKDSTYCGNWKIIVVAGMKQTTPHYLLLGPDSLFFTSADSTFSSYHQNASQGKWKITATGDVELIPIDTSHAIHYYKHVSEWRFKYYETEKNGLKTAVVLQETDIFIEKLRYAAPVNNGKKKNK